MQTQTTKLPNFFLIGAPKCGTTTLASALAQHPQVFMSTPKEPNHFSTDITSLDAVQDRDAYLKLFDKADPNTVAIGEASTTYLRSAIAIPKINSFVPDAKLIVCLRNPVDMAVSAHMQLFRGGRECEADFMTAWELQQKRLVGDAVPQNAIEPKDLQYKELCQIGAQCQRLIDRVEPCRILFIFLEEFQDKVRTAERVATFLGISQTPKLMIEQKNKRWEPRNSRLSRLLSAGAEAKRQFGYRNSLGIANMVNQLNRKHSTEAASILSRSDRRRLLEEFRTDISLLSQVTGRNLEHWFQTD